MKRTMFGVLPRYQNGNDEIIRVRISKIAQRVTKLEWQFTAGMPTSRRLRQRWPSNTWTISNESQGTAGCSRYKTLKFGPPYKTPVVDDYLLILTRLFLKLLKITM
ncbi:jg21551 [Pararge aegeria aegeria]|uniref:Jg21551 protein n=1 Tax=Pararge aegeria aegeria TaxID=348720 RepID=A0A8S4RSR6_9NEOP|nr:jg21551 [Pararge aegeria aegeria]